MADVAILSTRATITTHAPTLANRRVKITASRRAEPAEDEPMRDFLFGVLIFAKLVVQIDNVRKGSALLYNTFGII